MKTIIATAIALTIATSASAGGNLGTDSTVTWGGSSGVLYAEQCTWHTPVDGEMTYNSGNNTWELSKPASIKLNHKGAAHVKVFGGTTLKDTNIGVSVDYRNYTWLELGNANNTILQGSTQGFNVNDTNADFPIPSYATKYYKDSKLVVGGKATMTQANEEKMSENTDYEITHRVECHQ
jgi:hypothetical protein